MSDLLTAEMCKKLSLDVDKPQKKISNCSLGDVPPRKKSSLKENVMAALRSPNFVLKRESARKRWGGMREKLKLNRIKVAVTESKLFSPGERRRRSAENRTEVVANQTLSPRLSPNEWQVAFDNLIFDDDGREAFMRFLQSEYSEENILFWWAAEQLKDVVRDGDRTKFEETVTEMYDTFIATESPLAINIDHDTRKDIITRVENQEPNSYPENIFEKAQAHVYRLMEKDCFSRFVHTTNYKEVAKKLALPQSFRFNGRVSPHV